MEELKQGGGEKRGGRQNRQTLFGNNSAEMAEMEGNSRNGMEPTTTIDNSLWLPHFEAWSIQVRQPKLQREPKIKEAVIPKPPTNGQIIFPQAAEAWSTPQITLELWCSSSIKFNPNLELEYYVY